MKIHQLLMLSAALIALPACEKKEPLTEEVKEEVDDALDRRPAEGVQDAAEDAGAAAKEAARDTKDAVKDAAGEVKEATKDAVE